MPLNAAFNVLVGATPSNGGSASALTATSHNRQEQDPNTVVFVTSNFNPGGKGGTANLGATYAEYAQAHEYLLNWGPPRIPDNASFNLLIFAS